MWRPEGLGAAIPGIQRRGPVVLLYHRVSIAGDEFRLAVTESHFKEHLDVLAGRVDVMPLGDLADPARRARLPRQAVAITFDDGYADNLHVVAPLLEEADAPASFFVTTGRLGHEFWWDALERLLVTPSALPEVLEIVLAGRRYHWRVSDLRTRRRKHLPIRTRVSGPKPAARSLLHRLHPLLRDLEEEERWKALAHIERWASHEGIPGMMHRCMTADEVAELSGCRLVTVGGHTVTHPRLRDLPGDRQRQEIRSNLDRLEEITGRRPDAFAYPYGQPGQYSPETVRIVREVGLRYACSASPGTVRSGTDPLQLPRIWVEDWDGEEFARRILRLVPGR
jgi:peptidoglycan/xylan/chitin deacetylase (PgdA/CDA1 family)